jgi:hypothetical protein
LPETRPSPSHSASAETDSLRRPGSWLLRLRGGPSLPPSVPASSAPWAVSGLGSATRPRTRHFASPLTASCTVSACTSREGRQRSGSRLSWGPWPSSRHRLRESAWLPVTDRSASDLRKHHPGARGLSVLRLSQPLDGLAPPAAWRPCFMPHATCRVPSLQGVSLPGSLTRLVAWPCPLAVTASPAGSPSGRNPLCSLR